MLVFSRHLQMWPFFFYGLIKHVLKASKVNSTTNGSKVKIPDKFKLTRGQNLKKKLRCPLFALSIC